MKPATKRSSAGAYWEASWAAMQKRVFFFNRLTGTSQWAKPDDLDGDLAQCDDQEFIDIQARVQKEAGPMPKDWTAAWDEHHKRVYYYRPSTGQRSWHKPFVPQEKVTTLLQSKDDNCMEGETSASIALFSQQVPKPSLSKTAAARDPLIQRVPWDSFTFAHRIADARNLGNSQKVVQNLHMELFESNRRVVASPWITPTDYREWRLKMETLGKNDNDNEWKFRVQKANAKYGLKIPTSIYVKYNDCYQAMMSREVPETGAEPKVVFWELQNAAPTGRPKALGVMQEDRCHNYVDVLRYLARRQKLASGEVVGVSMANGQGPAGYLRSQEHPHESLGNYADGHDGSEAELCRRMPALWPSLIRGTKDFQVDDSDSERQWPAQYSEPDHPFFPYGPSTCADAKSRARYSDGIYTPRVEIARGDETSGYALLDHTQRAAVNILSMAPPVANTDLDASHLIRGSLLAMFVGPKIMDPNNEILVLPIWGCGAPWGNKAKDMATCFAQAIKGEVALPSYNQQANQKGPAKIRMGRFYKEIHFVFEPTAQDPEPAAGMDIRAVPRNTGEDQLEIFKKLWNRKYSIPYVMAYDDMQPLPSESR